MDAASLERVGGLLPTLPIVEKVSLVELGYEEGSEAHLVVNPTKTYLRAVAEAAAKLNAAMALLRDLNRERTEAEAKEDKERVGALNEEIAQATAESEVASRGWDDILLVTTRYVKLVAQGEEQEFGPPLTREDFERLDDLEPGLFNLLHDEMYERQKARYDRIQARFRRDRQERRSEVTRRQDNSQADGTRTRRAESPEETRRLAANYRVHGGESD